MKEENSASWEIIRERLSQASRLLKNSPSVECAVRLANQFDEIILDIVASQDREKYVKQLL